MNYPETFRLYFRCFAAFAALGSVVTLVSSLMRGSLHIDLTFFFWFWLSYAIGKARNYARVVALIISVGAVIGLVYALLTKSVHAELFGLEYAAGEIGYYSILIFLLLVFSLPLALFSSAAKQQFQKNEGA